MATTYRQRRRIVLAGVATAVVLFPLIWLWGRSLLPGQYSVMTMGYADYGGGPTGTSSAPASGTAGTGGMAGMAGMAGMGGTGGMGGTAGQRAVDITSLVADPHREADVTVRLVAREERFHLASGRVVDGFTFNGRSPGPLIRARVGQLVQVRLVNASVEAGVTIHWHGVNVPNAMDGVAGVTQDAVPVGGSFTYRFVARHAGTYWYHSHEISHIEVAKGLIGPLVIRPRTVDRSDRSVRDVVALAHLYDGRRTVDGRDGQLHVAVAPGRRVRVRIINTDNEPMPVWTDGAPYRVLAVDARDLHGPTVVSGRSILVTAGGRVDLGIRMPRSGSGVRVEFGGTAALALGHPLPRGEQPRTFVDLLHYGSPAPIGFDPSRPDRSFVYDIGRRPGFLAGRPGIWWTINGHLFPDVPMFMVAEGDVVRMTISNHSGTTHPMHLHGHHAVVLSRNGAPSTGSPWWIDSLGVRSGETYVIAFVADNPGVWMDHCHNLPHATQGLVSHLMYIGVTTPFLIGGDAHNEPA